ncbi:MAG: hypothetical protein QME68_05910 [Elusimicrobiota bacterium]|nr:hypothetical protein [Elusimicrobiota bacterium]
MNLEIWFYIFGDATIFGIIVGVFSVYNGRMTRKELSKIISETADKTQKILQEIDRRHTILLGKISETADKTQKILQEIDKRHTILLGKIIELISTKP